MYRYRGSERLAQWNIPNTNKSEILQQNLIDPLLSGLLTRKKIIKNKNSTTKNETQHKYNVKSFF